MSEPSISPAVELAWKKAADLALRTNDQFIEPKHLMYGIFSISGLGAKFEPPPSLSREDAESVRQESGQLSRIVERLQTDFEELRTAARQLCGEDTSNRSVPASTNRKVSRSEASRRCFQQAGVVAATGGRRSIDLLSLLPATIHASHTESGIGISEPLERLLRGLEANHKPSVSPDASALVTGFEDADESLGPILISQALDAGARVEPKHLTTGMERFACLCELAWEFGTDSKPEPLLQAALEQLLHMMGHNTRGAILIREQDSNDLLLKAHAPCTQPPTISTTSAVQAMSQKKAFIWTRGEDLSVSQREANIQAGLYAPLVINGESIGVLCVDSAVPNQPFGNDDLSLVASLAHQLALVIANYDLRSTLKRNAQVLERLLTNFSPKLRTRLLQRAQVGRLRLGGERSIVSILCSEIRGFTQLSANMDTDDLVLMLNEYLAALTECIFRHDGTVDKFIGDAILAVFGSPEADPQHCQNALCAAIDMQKAMEQVSQRRISRGDKACDIGIGIHTGEVLHGFIGSHDRMEYTVIGDAVNRAARYCAGAQGGEVLISPDVHQRVWKMIEADKISISTKHEGDLAAFRVTKWRAAAV